MPVARKPAMIAVPLARNDRSRSRDRENLASAVIPVTTVATTGPNTLRVGPPDHRYVYDRIPQTNSFLCRRGSDWAGPSDRLVLMLASNGRWTAFDVTGVTGIALAL